MKYRSTQWQLVSETQYADLVEAINAGLAMDDDAGEFRWQLQHGHQGDGWQDDKELPSILVRLRERGVVELATEPNGDGVLLRCNAANGVAVFCGVGGSALGALQALGLAGVPLASRSPVRASGPGMTPGGFVPFDKIVAAIPEPEWHRLVDAVIDSKVNPKDGKKVPFQHQKVYPLIGQGVKSGFTAKEAKDRVPGLSWTTLAVIQSLYGVVKREVGYLFNPDSVERQSPAAAATAAKDAAELDEIVQAAQSADDDTDIEDEVKDDDDPELDDELGSLVAR